MTGLEVGVVILFLTFPVKMAMKTLRPVVPALSLGLLYWLLLAFVALHCVIIIFYSKIEGVQLKNIVKAYYQTITPLVFYGLLLRYCEPRTVKPTAMAIFFTTLGVSVVSMPIIFLNLPFDVLTSLKISVDWTNSSGAAGLFRSTGLLMITGALAWWPAGRTISAKLILAGTILLAAIGTLLSGGRASLVQCLVAAFLFSVLRKKIWIAALFALFVGCVSLFISANPRVLYVFPDAIHRTLLPLDLSSEGTEIKDVNEGSDRWHHDLLVRSLDYWLADGTSILVGHGFKSWDDSNNTDPDYWANPEVAIVTAIEMGNTENAFSAITNIFGSVGLVLYMLFLFHLAWRLWTAMRASPFGSPARALCEFSLVYLVLYFLFIPWLGSAPRFNLIYWSLGLLAARQFLNSPAAASPAPRPAFDLSHQVPEQSAGSRSGEHRFGPRLPRPGFASSGR